MGAHGTLKLIIEKHQPHYLVAIYQSEISTVFSLTYEARYLNTASIQREVAFIRNITLLKSDYRQ